MTYDNLNIAGHHRWETVGNGKDDGIMRQHLDRVGEETMKLLKGS